MKISSTFTWFLPFAVLFAASCSLTWQLWEKCSHDSEIYDAVFYSRVLLISFPLTALLYYLCRIEVLKAGLKYFRYLLLLLPLLIDTVLPMIISGTFTFSFLPILNGFLLFFSFNLFMNRYTAMLTANAIEYENLFGQKGSIPLTVITKLEQKRNILAFFREFRLLEFAKKTGICFMDENMDEFEINIYTNSFENKRVFDSIINNANQCNNYKIRMYTT